MKKVNRLGATVVMCAASLFVSACGGGSGGGSTPATLVDAGTYKVDMSAFNVPDAASATDPVESANFRRAEDAATQFGNELSIELGNDSRFVMRLSPTQTSEGTWTRDGDKIVMHTETIAGEPLEVPEGTDPDSIAKSTATVVEPGKLQLGGSGGMVFVRD